MREGLTTVVGGTDPFSSTTSPFTLVVGTVGWCSKVNAARKPDSLQCTRTTPECAMRRWGDATSCTWVVALP